MALTGKLEADFSAFTAASEKAVSNLAVLESSGNKAAVAVNRINEAGKEWGKSSVADTTSSAYKAFMNLGDAADQATPKLRGVSDETVRVTQASQGWSLSLGSLNSLLGAFGVGLSVSGLVAFGKSLIDDADSLTKLHDKTGISVEGLQIMRAAGDDAGVSLESMTKAVTTLQEKLGSGNASAVSALKDFNINVEDFKRLDGAKQMELLSDAVRASHDPLRTAASLSDLFGKSWADQLPVLKKGFQDVSDGIRIMSTDTVRHLDAAGDAVDRFWRSTKAVFGEALITALSGTTSGYRAWKSSIEDAAAAGTKANVTFADSSITLRGLPSDLAAVDAGFKAEEEALKKATAASDAHKRALEGLTEQLSGRGVLAAAKDYEAVLIDVGGAERLTAEEKAKLADAFQRVIDKYLLMGPVGRAVVEHFAELKFTIEPLSAKLREIESGFIGSASAMEHLGVKVKPVIADIAGLGVAAGLSAAEIERLFTVVVGKANEAAEAVKSVAAAQYQLYGGVPGAPATVGEQVRVNIEKNLGPQSQLPSYSGIPMVGRRAMGGAVSPGSPYLVGERGPELFVPRTSGSIVPNGGGGIHMTNNITVNGSVLANKTELGNVIAQALTDHLVRRGIRFPTGV